MGDDPPRHATTGFLDRASINSVAPQRQRGGSAPKLASASRPPPPRGETTVYAGRRTSRHRSDPTSPRAGDTEREERPRATAVPIFESEREESESFESEREGIEWN